MQLTKDQRPKLHQALLSAFPTRPALTQMVQFCLDENLDAITQGGGLSATVFDLIQWAEAQGRIEELIREAHRTNSGNQALSQFVASLGLAAPAPAATSAAPAPGLSPTASAPAAQGPIEVFYSYSHKDAALRDKLETHLSTLKRQGVISGWHDRKISAGAEWAGQIDWHLNTAGVILLLISADFLASNYCYEKEMQRAMERHEAGEARVIPIILRDVDWSGAPFSKLQALPTDARPVTRWSNRDTAFADVARGIRAAVAQITGQV